MKGGYHPKMRVDGEVHHQHQDRRPYAAGDDQVPLHELLGLPHVAVDGVQLLAVDILLPDLLHVHVLHQLVQGQAEVVAEQDQPLEVRVGLAGLPLGDGLAGDLQLRPQLLLAQALGLP